MDHHECEAKFLPSRHLVYGVPVLALAAVALALTRPPAAYLDTGAKHVPLTISSWCLAARCGAPIARARRVASVRRGATVRVHLAYAPTQVALAVSGFVTYVGRVALH
jgi:hypothetical protein